MTIGQLIFDALTWCRYYAVNVTIGRPEVKVVFFEAFQDVYRQAVESHAEFFTKSVAFSGTSFLVPIDFRRELALVVNDTGATSGYAKMIPSEEWDTRQLSTRNAASVTDPQARLDTTTFTVAPTVADGILYYIRNYAEVDLTDETKDIGLFLPLVYHPLLLSKMEELIRMRHFKVPEDATQRERHLAVAQMSNAKLKRSLKPLELLEGLSEKPQGIQVTA